MNNNLDKEAYTCSNRFSLYNLQYRNLNTLARTICVTLRTYIPYPKFGSVKPEISAYLKLPSSSSEPSPIFVTLLILKNLY